MADAKHYATIRGDPYEGDSVCAACEQDWPCTESVLEGWRAADKAKSALAAYARLAADGDDIDREMYLLDPVYHAIVYRIHRGRPRMDVRSGQPHAEAVWEDYSARPPKLKHTGQCVVDDLPWPCPEAKGG